MSYQALTRRRLLVLEIRLPLCALTHSTSPCTATRADGAECYNSRRTCQDATNFDGSSTLSLWITWKGTRPVRDRTVFPLLVDYSPIAGEIQESDAGGSDHISFRLADRRHSGAGFDPYFRTRPIHLLEDGQPEPDPWLIQTLVKRHHMEGREVYVYEKDDDGSGILDLSAITPKLYFLDTPVPAGADGREWDFVATDLMGRYGEAMVPAPSEGELLNAMDGSTTTLTLKSGQGADYGTAPFFVWVDKELMAVSARSTDTLTVTRAQGGTTAAAHSADARVQKSFSIEDSRIDDAWEAVWLAAGVPSGYLDTAYAEDVVDRWQGGWKLTFHAKKPRKLRDWAKEFARQCSARIYWPPSVQKLRYDHNRPPNVGEEAATFRDGESIIRNTAKRKPRPADRFNEVVIYFGVTDWSISLDQIPEEAAAGLSRVVIRVDADAQSADEYGDERVLEVFAWMVPENMSAAMSAMAYRTLNAHRDVPEDLILEADARVADLVELGDFVELETDQLVDFAGRTQADRALVIRKEPPRDATSTASRFVLRPLNLFAAYGRYAPSGTAAWDDDTDYGHYANASGLMPNGDPGQTYG